MQSKDSIISQKDMVTPMENRSKAEKYQKQRTRSIQFDLKETEGFGKEVKELAKNLNIT